LDNELQEIATKYARKPLALSRIKRQKSGIFAAIYDKN